MKLFFVLIILLFINNCSFDNKSGIWKNEKFANNKDSNLFNDFKTLGINTDNFNEEISLSKKLIFNTPLKINNAKWEDVYYNQFNNFDNFGYEGKEDIIFKSKKISNSKLNYFFLHDEENYITTDEKGNLIVFSKEKNEVITKFNFYKKKYKKLKKKLNIVISENIIYVSDNFGFIYAFDYRQKIILWAKNTRIPFRSNLKIIGDKLIAADQNNKIYILNKKSGATIKLIPTEETKIKNNFKNNFSYNKKFIFMLNTYGSLYSIDINTSSVRWVVNLNQSLDINPNNLFNGKEIVSNDNLIVVTSHEATYIINSDNGVILKKFNIISKVKPLITDNKLFLISLNSLLISINLDNGEILYSYNINKKIAEFLDTKEETVSFESIFISNNKIFVFLKNSYLLEFGLHGNLTNVIKLPFKINSNLIFINKFIIFLDYKKKLIILS
tara:strand:- start:180 stop:1505 length:1326 start_codon:yes stop_codon:yes gene_type:complete